MTKLMLVESKAYFFIDNSGNPYSSGWVAFLILRLETKKMHVVLSNKIWLCLILLWVVSAVRAQDALQIKTTLLSQKIYKSADGPTDYRSLRFRFVNLTKHSILIHGHGDDDGFHPVSYSLRFDEAKKEWIYPTSDNLPIRWQQMKNKAYHTQQLLPQKSIILEVKIRFEKPSELVKKVFYVASDIDKEPYQIMSLPFRLK